MYYLSCDMCKKMIQDPRRGKAYTTLKHLHICKKCMLTVRRDFQDKAEAEAKPYDFLTKKEEFWATIAKNCSR